MRSSMWRGFLCNPAPDAVFHAKEDVANALEAQNKVRYRTDE